MAQWKPGKKEGSGKKAGSSSGVNPKAGKGPANNLPFVSGTLPMGPAKAPVKPFKTK